MAKTSAAACKKCGKKYPRWRLEQEGVCEARISTEDGWKRCCGSIVAAKRNVVKPDQTVAVNYLFGSHPDSYGGVD